MIVEETDLKGVLVVKPASYKDKRGYFFESFKKNLYAQYGISEEFVQDNLSKSKKGTIRGLHYQVGEFAQGKLCQVLEGKVLDVAVDIRFGSPTFGKYTVAELSEENHYRGRTLVLQRESVTPLSGRLAKTRRKKNEPSLNQQTV